MKKLIRGILAVSALAIAVSSSAQTAEEIVSKYVAAIGGKEAISQVKSMYMESSVSMMGGENPSTTTIVDGVGYKNETEFNGTKIVQCYTDKGGWAINPMAGPSAAEAMTEDVYNSGKGQINIGGPLYDYAAKGSKIELFGKEGTAYKIKLTSKENVESIYVIDSTTFLPVSMTSTGKMQEQEVNIITKFSDFRKTDVGYMIPYAIDLDIGGQFNLSIAIKKVELNKTIDPAVFAMPK